MFYLAKTSWPWIVVRGVLAIILGVLAIVWPGATLMAIGLMLGFWFLLDGVGSVLNAVSLRGASTGSRVLVGLLGLVGIVAGLIAVTRPAVAVGAVGLLLAVWLIVTGVGQAVLGWRIRREISGEWLLVAGGVLGALIGVALLVWPGLALGTLVTLLAASALVTGAFLVIAGFKLRGVVRRHEDRAGLR